jgi:hypothetical protein
MSFNSPFTGQVIQPTDVSYRDITLVADGTLTWPINGSVTDNAAARIMDVTSLSSGLVLSGVTVIGSNGQCSCTATPSLFIGQAVTVTGVLTGTATGLTPGVTYTAQIYRDGDAADWVTNPYDLVVEERLVDAGTILKMKLAPGGGQAVRFVRN